MISTVIGGRGPAASAAAAPRLGGRGAAPAAPQLPRSSVPLRGRCKSVRVRYTSQQGRMGEGGEEETSLRDSINKMTSEKQYGSTFRTGGEAGGGGSGHAPVDEEKEPGFHHESRKDLEKRGAVVHEEVLPGVPHTSPASAPESGTEGRTPGSGAGTESAHTAGPTTSPGGGGGGSSQQAGSESEDYSWAPESGTR
ncbi:hypothetical protein PLESTF_001348200 [Pleodorina starrii]|nr:hypothetical protein PLESTF_001348200 [Pleodorina starrii]